MEMAETDNAEGVPLRVVRALHLALTALKVGRRKDRERLLALLDASAVTRAEIEEGARRHGLSER